MDLEINFTGLIALIPIRENKNTPPNEAYAVFVQDDDHTSKLIMGCSKPEDQDCWSIPMKGEIEILINGQPITAKGEVAFGDLSEMLSLEAMGKDNDNDHGHGQPKSWNEVKRQSSAWIWLRKGTLKQIPGNISYEYCKPNHKDCRDTHMLAEGFTLSIPDLSERDTIAIRSDNRSIPAVFADPKAPKLWLVNQPSPEEWYDHLRDLDHLLHSDRFFKLSRYPSDRVPFRKDRCPLRGCLDASAGEGVRTGGPIRCPTALLSPY